VGIKGDRVARVDRFENGDLFDDVERKVAIVGGVVKV
jgi:hypothetical protein